MNSGGGRAAGDEPGSLVQVVWQDIDDGRRHVENIGPVALEVVSARGRRPLPPGGSAVVELDEAVVTPELGTFRQPRVDLVQLIQRATEFARLWRMQDGCSATVLDELADAIEGYVGDREVTPSAYYCPECATKRPLADPCEHVDIEPGTLRRIRELFGVPIDDPVRDRVHVRDATDAEQRAALVEWDRSQPGGSAPRPPRVRKALERGVPIPKGMQVIVDEVARRRDVARGAEGERYWTTAEACAVGNELDELLAFLAGFSGMGPSPAPAPALPDVERFDAWVSSREFFDMLQAYRHSPIEDLCGTADALQAVKAAIRKAVRA